MHRHQRRRKAPVRRRAPTPAVRRIKAARRLHEGRRADALPAGQRLIESTFARWNQLIAQTTSDRATLAGGDSPLQVGSPIRAAAFYLIKEHGLESYDATHAATAINYGAPLLTADKHFADIPAGLLTLLTDSDQTDEFRARRQRGS